MIWMSKQAAQIGLIDLSIPLRESMHRLEIYMVIEEKLVVSERYKPCAVLSLGVYIVIKESITNSIGQSLNHTEYNMQ